MFRNYYGSEYYVQHLLSGPAGAQLNEFANLLWEAGYSQITARLLIRGARHLVHWSEIKRIPLAEMTNAKAEQFKHHLRNCRCQSFGCRGRRGIPRGADLFIDHLRRVNVIPASAYDDHKGESSPLYDAFCKWMRENRNLSHATIQNYSTPVRDLLQVMGEDLSRLDAQNLRKFIINRNSCCGRGKAKIMVTALRAFVRFLISAGICPVGLDAAIPSIAYWRLSSLPRYLQAEEVERVIGGCNPNTATGVRDRAILLLLARLALRATDVVKLRLGDIDWQEGWISVCGKGRRRIRLPLLKEVGETIVEYVTKWRPRVNSDVLFLRSRAPLRGFPSYDAVTMIVARAMIRAGINRSVRGAAHILRHSAATTMLREGASLQDIAIVLRHQSIATASIYAKVDVSALREIAQPWPGEVDPC